MSNCLKGGGYLAKPILIHQRRSKPASAYALKRKYIPKKRESWRKMEYPVLVQD